MAPLHLPDWHRGRELLNQQTDFQKTRDCQSIAGFLLGNGAAGEGGADEKKNQNMKANYRQIPARFGPEVGFEIRPRMVAPFRLEVEDPLEALKRRMLAERLEDVWGIRNSTAW